MTTVSRGPFFYKDWARNVTVGSPAGKAVLIALADHANSDGECWPSQKRLSTQTELSERTVRGHLADLEERGFIERAYRSRGDGGRTSDMIVLVGPPVTDAGGPRQESHHPPAGDAAPPRQEMPGKHSEGTPLVEARENASSSAMTVSGRDAAFDAFWENYPRKVGKKGARREWDKAVKDIGPEWIIEAALQYQLDPNREDAFTKHPTTWLHQGCWEDDPLPARNVTPIRPSKQQERRARLAETLQRVAAADGVTLGQPSPRELEAETAW